jgi:hypothetical protein
MPILTQMVLMMPLVPLLPLLPIYGNMWRTLFFTDFDTTDNIFTDIIIHAKVFSVRVMSVIILIMSDNLLSCLSSLFLHLNYYICIMYLFLFRLFVKEFNFNF